ncbi:hypothetical protein RDV78_07680 [Bacillota bacterium LX-D]|nr:hypothetical protein [Bacillota bacterium LX-D]
MCVPTLSIIAMRCPACNQLELHSLSFFDFARQRTYKMECSCGRSLLSVGTKDRKMFWLQIDCEMCESKHLYYFKRKQIWSENILEIECTDTGIEIAYIGPKEKIRQCVQQQNRSLEDIAQEVGFVDYFDNPEVMYQILDRINEIAEAGELRCQCGNQNIEIEVFPDSLELRCEDCNSIARIKAETAGDIENFKNASRIQLTECGFNFVKLSKATRRKRSNNGKTSKR